MNACVFDCHRSREARWEELLLTLRRLLSLRFIHDIEIGAEQPVEKSACSVSRLLVLEVFIEDILFPVDCEPNTATRL
jgi:hypothetical protein